MRLRSSSTLGLVAPRPSCSPRALASPPNALKCSLQSLVTRTSLRATHMRLRSSSTLGLVAPRPSCSPRALASAQRTRVFSPVSRDARSSLRDAHASPLVEHPLVCHLCRAARHPPPPGESALPAKVPMPARVSSRRKCPPGVSALPTKVPSPRMRPPGECALPMKVPSRRKCPALRSRPGLAPGPLGGPEYESRANSRSRKQVQTFACSSDHPEGRAKRGGAARRPSEAGRQAGRQAGKRGRQSVGPFERPSM